VKTSRGRIKVQKRRATRPSKKLVSRRNYRIRTYCPVVRIFALLDAAAGEKVVITAMITTHIGVMSIRYV
jgi:hypothetical protein